MTYDGARALLKGDYVRPKTGKYAGQLGPWSKLVRKIGVDPESNLMKWIFVIYGTAWLIVIGFYAFGASWGWKAMMAFAIGSLWYLMLGTGFSLLVIILLFFIKNNSTI